MDDGVVALTITTDEEPHVDLLTVALLDAAADMIRADTGIRALVIEGGTRHFCSGAPQATLQKPDAPAAIAELMGGLPRALLRIPVPTLAAMAGHALGGGLMLGLWCDLQLLAEESLYGANFLALGFTPGMGATVLLDELLGAPLAADLLWTGRTVKGRDLKAAGVPLSHAIVPRADVVSAAYAKAAEIARAPREALSLFKEHVAARRRAQLQAALAHELAMHTAIFAHPETRARIAENYPAPFPDGT